MTGKPKLHNEEIRLLKQQEAEDRKEEKKEYLERQLLELQDEERHKERRPDRSSWRDGL